MIFLLLCFLEYTRAGAETQVCHVMRLDNKTCCLKTVYWKFRYQTSESLCNDRNASFCQREISNCQRANPELNIWRYTMHYTSSNMFNHTFPYIGTNCLYFSTYENESTYCNILAIHYSKIYCYLIYLLFKVDLNDFLHPNT